MRAAGSSGRGSPVRAVSHTAPSRDAGGSPLPPVVRQAPGTRRGYIRGSPREASKWALDTRVFQSAEKVTSRLYMIAEFVTSEV
ncbi:hypothetical protein BN159_p90 (plasmid) [Streptomyces davaonensis JCM 4913]|uniref:Uncharacterized protein n=1 Tax=Streptomyces davaonensis (strain DSM 101723 / JCM 4913 / KCC S-0913 / 768) TaxID=1214101 RepID=K4RGP3_STRDJ|nr:hypothetical protein BN159_p90 [Streptomyces davaonensis JCM 4913]